MKQLFILLLCALPFMAGAQTAASLADELARSALEHNRVLAAAGRDVETTRQDRKSAFGAFLPSVDLLSRHSWADGGREISFDVNDFLPPEILPVDVPESVIPFLRAREQETKLQVTQPLFVGGGLYYSYRASQKAEAAAEADFAAQSAELVRQVRTAYYGYLQARELHEVDLQQQALAAEQLRVTRALFEVDKLSQSELKRAEAGSAASEAAVLNSQARADAARQMLNLLLDRDLTTEIPLPADSSLVLAALDANPLQHRPELQSIDLSEDALTQQKRAVRSRLLPAVSAAFEYGYQGEKYDFNNKQDYYLLSGVLSWNLFEGFRSSIARQKVELARRKLEDQRAWVERQVEQQAATAALTLQAKQAELEAARRALAAAAESHRLADLRFREGMGSQLDITDARTTLASAAANEVLARYGVLIAYADYEYSLGISLERLYNE